LLRGPPNNAIKFGKHYPYWYLAVTEQKVHKFGVLP